MALSFGWNDGCVDARDDCGKRDLLFGRAVDASDASGAVAPLATLVPYGRLLAEPLGNKPGAPFRLRRATPLDAATVRLCAAGADGQRPSSDDWEQCRGRGIVDIAAEGWGQGHARSSALGVAGMMAALAAAANGQADVRKPHLVDGLRGVGPAKSARLESGGDALGSRDSPCRTRIAHDAAEVILSGLSYSHRGGTARLACEQVFDAAHLPRDRLDRRKDRNADVSQRRALAGRADPALRRRCRQRAQRSQRVRTAASVQMVRRGLPDRSRTMRAGPRRSAC